MSYEVIIVGSGVAGLASAYRLATDHEVLVLDRDAIGSGTSSRASGVITTPVDYPGQRRWSRNALEYFRALDGTGVFEWVDREYVRGIRPEDVEGAEERAEAEGVCLVDVSEYDDYFEADTPYETALVWNQTGYFDVNGFLATIRRECARRGVEFRPDTTVESVLVEDGSAIGIETEFGAVEADAVIVTAGSETRALLADILALPLKKFTWNVAYLDANLPGGYPMGGDATLRAYWRGTRDGHLLVGTEHSYDGEPVDERTFGEKLDRLVRDELPHLLAHVETNTEIVRYECCPLADATTPDARAIIDSPDEGPDDLVVAAGFHGAGVMAADSIGAAVRAHLTDEDPPFPLEPFALARFETRRKEFPFHSLFRR